MANYSETTRQTYHKGCIHLRQSDRTASPLFHSLFPGAVKTETDMISLSFSLSLGGFCQQQLAKPDTTKINIIMSLLIFWLTKYYFCVMKILLETFLNSCPLPLPFYYYYFFFIVVRFIMLLSTAYHEVFSFLETPFFPFSCTLS